MILDAASPDDYERWISLWQRWPTREVAAHPAYVRLFARSADKVICVAREWADGGVLFPFICRPLRLEPWADAEEPYSDLITPYGYGGPFAWGMTPDRTKEFWISFEEWFKSANIVTTFSRLSLFPDQLTDIPYETVVERQNVVRTLDLSTEATWMEYAHKVRKNVTRARKEGVRIEFDEDDRRIDDFLYVYENTMDRREAGDGYYFGRHFFENVCRDLPGQYAFFYAIYQEKVISTELVLVSSDNLYSFLGGTVADYFPLRPNDLLKHEVIEWGRQRGKKAFVMGGGFEETDGIFRYKLAFAPKGAVEFRLGRWTHDNVANERLVEQRRKWELEQGKTWSPKPTYFPQYRASSI